MRGKCFHPMHRERNNSGADLQNKFVLWRALRVNESGHVQHCDEYWQYFESLQRTLELRSRYVVFVCISVSHSYTICSIYLFAVSLHLPPAAFSSSEYVGCTAISRQQTCTIRSYRSCHLRFVCATLQPVWSVGIRRLAKQDGVLQSRVRHRFVIFFETFVPSSSPYRQRTWQIQQLFGSAQVGIF